MWVCAEALSLLLLILGLVVAAPALAEKAGDAKAMSSGKGTSKSASSDAMKKGKGMHEPHGVREVCKGDIERMCLDVQGRVAVFKCLDEHISTTTPECQAAIQGRLDRIEHRMDELIDACQADVEAFCGDGTDVHRGEVFRCLDKHQDELSATCTQALASAHGKRGKHGMGGMHGMHGMSGEAEEACHEEFVALCPDAKGHDALHECIGTKLDQVSEGCRAHFETCQERHGDE